MTEETELDRETRSRIYAAIQAESPFFGNPDVSGVPDAAIITGWVVVAEWMANDGNRWLTLNSGDPAGNRLPAWTVLGYCCGAQELANEQGNGDDGGGDD